MICARASLRIPFSAHAEQKLRLGLSGRLAMAVATGSSSLTVPEPKDDATFELNLLNFGFASAHRPFHWPIFPVNLRI